MRIERRYRLHMFGIERDFYNQREALQHVLDRGLVGPITISEVEMEYVGEELVRETVLYGHEDPDA